VEDPDIYVVSRQIERIGDNAVDIGEQVAFLVTGEFRCWLSGEDPGPCWYAPVRR
jgi:phosphate transport system protein